MFGLLPFVLNNKEVVFQSRSLARLYLLECLLGESLLDFFGTFVFLQAKFLMVGLFLLEFLHDIEVLSCRIFF
jgi:hypothetical protein